MATSKWLSFLIALAFSLINIVPLIYALPVQLNENTAAVDDVNDPPPSTVFPNPAVFFSDTVDESPAPPGIVRVGSSNLLDDSSAMGRYGEVRAVGANLPFNEAHGHTLGNGLVDSFTRSGDNARTPKDIVRRGASFQPRSNLVGDSAPGIDSGPNEGGPSTSLSLTNTAKLPNPAVFYSDFNDEFQTLPDDFGNASV